MNEEKDPGLTSYRTSVVSLDVYTSCTLILESVYLSQDYTQQHKTRKTVALKYTWPDGKKLISSHSSIRSNMLNAMNTVLSVVKFLCSSEFENISKHNFNKYHNKTLARRTEEQHPGSMYIRVMSKEGQVEPMAFCDCKNRQNSQSQYSETELVVSKVHNKVRESAFKFVACEQLWPRKLSFQA